MLWLHCKLQIQRLHLKQVFSQILTLVSEEKAEECWKINLDFSKDS